MTHNQERKEWIEPDLEMVQTFKLSDRDLIIAIINYNRIFHMIRDCYSSCLSKGNKNRYVQKMNYIWIFIEALFIIVPSWKKSKYPLTDKWIYKLSYIHAIDYKSNKKKTTGTCNNINRQKKPDIKDSMIQFIWISRCSKLMYRDKKYISDFLKIRIRKINNYRGA